MHLQSTKASTEQHTTHGEALELRAEVCNHPRQELLYRSRTEHNPWNHVGSSQRERTDGRHQWGAADMDKSAWFVAELNESWMGGGLPLLLRHIHTVREMR